MYLGTADMADMADMDCLMHEVNAVRSMFSNRHFLWQQGKLAIAVEFHEMQ